MIVSRPEIYFERQIKRFVTPNVMIKNDITSTDVDPTDFVKRNIEPVADDVGEFYLLLMYISRI